MIQRPRAGLAAPKCLMLPLMLHLAFFSFSSCLFCFSFLSWPSIINNQFFFFPFQHQHAKPRNHQPPKTPRQPHHPTRRTRNPSIHVLQPWRATRRRLGGTSRNPRLRRQQNRFYPTLFGLHHKFTHQRFEI